MGVHKGRGLRGEFGLFSVNFSIFGFRVRWISLFFLASEIGLMSTTPKNTKMDQPMKTDFFKYPSPIIPNGTNLNFNKTSLIIFLKLETGSSIALSRPEYIYN